MNELHKQGGFSLIEALIALAILAIGVMAVITMLDTSFMAGRISGDYTQCSDVAAYIIDDLRFQLSGSEDIGAVVENKLNTYDNDASGDLVVDTALPSPVNDPGKYSHQLWKNMIEKKLKDGRAVVKIVRNDPNYANMTSVRITIEWSGLGRGMLNRSVIFDTILH